jgi:alpha-tubulin suppressor-like RCC1 family protein
MRAHPGEFLPLRALALSSLLSLLGCTDFAKVYEQCVETGRCEPVVAQCDGGVCPDAGALCDGGPCCDGGSCHIVPDPLANGQACTSGSECDSGHCADGVCCDTACDGQCEACSETPGTCTAVTGEPLGGRAACTGAGTSCGGACDGTVRTACVYPTTACRAASCSGGMATAAATCSNGECPNVTTPCPGNICGASACATVTEVTAGYDFTCALLSDGTVKCWGENSAGQAGQDPDGNGGDDWRIATPRTVAGLTNVTQIAAGYGFACARISDGTVKCWGTNYYGQLGLGTTDNTPHFVPTAVPSLTGINRVAASSNGYHACVVSTTGSKLWCWGGNFYGQLGDGTQVNRSTPTPVCTSGSTAGSCVQMGNVSAIQLGDGHSCSRYSSGGIYCWGSNGVNQLNLAKPPNEYLNPTNTTLTTSHFSAPLAAGGGATCVVAADGSAKCFGGNSSGRLGLGFTTSPTLAAPLCATSNGTSCTASLGGIAMISLGENHGCAVVSGANVKCWGWMNNGQLGDGLEGSGKATTASVSPLGLSGVNAVVAGSYHTCAKLIDGTVRCWGWNSSGQVGNGSADDVVLTPVSPTW